jgi:integrase
MEDETPTLLTLMFGQAAGTVRRGASPRLLRWAEAFDEWLAERERQFKPTIRKPSTLAWRRLAGHCSKMPWEVEAKDVARHAEGMRAEGLAPSTVYADLGMLAMFYKWCAEKGIDEECGPFFNPAGTVIRKHSRSYERVQMLSRREVEALLWTIRADRSPLGLREYAFMLTRLHTGAPLKRIQQLQWGQIGEEGGGAWVRWRREGYPTLLEEEAWEAIEAYLAGSGRLATLREESYVFVPLIDPTDPEGGRKAEDWAEKPLSSNQILKNLKVYGRAAGIGEEKLNLETLRLTATRLRVIESNPVELPATQGMEAFLDSQSAPRVMAYRLRLLPPLAKEPTTAEEVEGQEKEEASPTGSAPNRLPKRFLPGEGLVHGLFARHWPMEEIQAVLEEEIEGVEEQIAGLRAMARGLMERQRATADRAAAVRLIDLYSQVTTWLSILIQTDEILNKPGEFDDLERQLDEAVDSILKDTEEPPEFVFQDDSSEEAEERAFELSLTERGMLEETATLRYFSRSLLAAAVQAQDTEEYARMVQHYGRLSIRLARVLRREKAGQGQRTFDELTKAIDSTVEEVLKDWKF